MRDKSRVWVILYVLLSLRIDRGHIHKFLSFMSSWCRVSGSYSHHCLVGHGSRPLLVHAFLVTSANDIGWSYVLGKVGLDMRGWASLSENVGTDNLSQVGNHYPVDGFRCEGSGKYTPSSRIRWPTLDRKSRKPQTPHRFYVMLPRPPHVQCNKANDQSYLASSLVVPNELTHWVERWL